MADGNGTRLENGHEASTPIADSYLRRFVMNWIETTETMALAAGGASLRSDRFWAADVGRPASYTNTTTLIQPVTAAAGELMADIETFYAANDGVRRETYVFSPWPTPDLRPYGWLLGGHPPLHLLPAGATRPPAPEGFRIERVKTAESLATFERIAIAAYPLYGLENNPPFSLFALPLLDLSRVRLVLGFDGVTPVGVGVSAVDHGINQVMLIATLPEARGRGFGAALTWESSLADPALPAMLLSSDIGRPVYEKMGYLPLFRFTVWYRRRS
jgi:hypothetical protein